MEYWMEELNKVDSDINKVGRKYLRNSVGWKNLWALGGMKRACCRVLHLYPLPSSRHHRSSDDCPAGKRENYQVCSVQYCAQQLCTVQCTHIWTDL